MMASLLNSSCVSVSSSSNSHQWESHRRHTRRPPRRFHGHVASCKSRIRDENNAGEAAATVHRRNLLIGGLGGLYTATCLSSEKAARGAPLQPPDDENAEILRIKVRNCPDSPNLGHIYQEVDMPWIGTRPTPLGLETTTAVPVSSSSSSGTRTEFPRTLDSVIKTRVVRPKKSRSKEEKEAEEEVLVIDRIQLPREVAAKFDVYINAEDEKSVARDSAEFVGSFVNVPQSSVRAKNRMKLINTCLRVGITDALDDLGADADDDVEVTLVPRLGTAMLTIGGIKIELLS